MSIEAMQGQEYVQIHAALAVGQKQVLIFLIKPVSRLEMYLSAEKSA